MSTAARGAKPASTGAGWVPPGGWIIGPREDFLLFLGTPILLLAVFAFAEHTWSMASLGVFTTILAMGHYLPGFVRAYGDRELFWRFPLRFTIAPVVLVGLSLYMATHELQAYLIVVVVWGAWHWLMQTYGLVRIYDAKAKNFDRTSATLDYALCISWFGILYWYTDGASSVLMHYYHAGGHLPPDVAKILAGVWVAATAAITIAYLVHMARRWRDGSPPSVLKLALLAVSFAFYLYAFGFTSSRLIAFGLFEGYHDIQYLAIVWVFNRGRVDKNANVGSFTRFLFRRRAPLILLYVFLCLGFGSYDYFARSISDATVARTALGLITGLALLHFYFDGFIWRIREPSTRSTLGVESGSDTGPGFRLPLAWRHAFLWLLLGIPVAGLGVLEWTSHTVGATDAPAAVVALRPDSHKAHYALSMAYQSEGQLDAALDHARRSRELHPGFDAYEELYADLLLANTSQVTENVLDEVISCYEQAIRYRSNSADLYLKLARALGMRRRVVDAEPYLMTALRLAPNNPAVHQEMATHALRQGDLATAIHHLQIQIQLSPDDTQAQQVLDAILAQPRTTPGG